MTNTDAAASTLLAVKRSLDREAHVLAERPDLTWQQLHNRLQWADPPFDRVTAERERRSRLGASLWLHQYTPPRESEALIRTLTGHAGGVSGVRSVPAAASSSPPAGTRR